MPSHGEDAAARLWVKLHELEMQLAAYKLLRREEGEVVVVGAWDSGGAACCRGRQYDAYMRRRDERRAAGAAAVVKKGQQLLGGRGGGGGGGTSTLTIKVDGRDYTQQAVVRSPARRTPGVSIPATTRKEHGALARSRTVSGGAAAAARTRHQRRNSFAGGIPADFLGDSDSATPRPFLRRGSGTGGAATRLRSPRRLRSTSELPFHATAEMGSPPTPAARARKRWGSPKTPPPVMFSAAATNPRMDFAKGLRKLLSFVTKSKITDQQHRQTRSGGGERDSLPATGWAAATPCSVVVDGPSSDRASLEQFAIARAVGTSR